MNYNLNLQKLADLIINLMHHQGFIKGGGRGGGGGGGGVGPSCIALLPLAIMSPIMSRVAI